MKILKHILTAVVWIVLGLYALFFVVFSIPAVQTYTAQRVAGLMASKLGTSVSIERLTFSLPTRVVLHHVNIKDQQGRNMLTAGRLSARLELLPLTEGKIHLSTAQVFGTHANLYQESADAEPNFQFVIDALASRDTTASTPLDLRINSLIMRSSSVRFDRYDVPETNGILNPQHLNLRDISAHIILKTLTEDSLNVNIKRLSLKEQSGLDISRLSMRVEAGRSSSMLKNFRLQMPGTDIKLGDITASYQFRDKEFLLPSLAFSGSIEPSKVTLADLACLLPSLRQFHSTLSIASTFSGQDEDMLVSALNISSTTADISLDMSGNIRQFRQSRPNWQATINDLKLSAKAVSFISENLEGHRVEVPDIVMRLGSIHLNGSANGKGLDEVQANHLLSTDAGSAQLNFMMDERRNFSGSIETKGFDMRRLLDDTHFGQLVTEVKLSGILPDKGTPIINADGTIHQFDYNGYRYQNILLNGTYNGLSLHSTIGINDPNARLRLEGGMEKGNHHDNIKLDVDIETLSPKHINLSDQWGEARFSGHLAADISNLRTPKGSSNHVADNVSNAIGTLTISNMTFDAPDEHYRLEDLHVESGYDNGIHYLRMNSDFGRAEITGDFNYKTLAQSFTNFVASKLPTLPGLPKVNPNTSNNFSFEATINKTDWVNHLLRIPLTLTEPLTLNGMVNDKLQQVNLQCNIPQFFYKESRYDRGRISLLSPLNTLYYDLSVSKLMDNGNSLDVSMTGNAFNNQLTTALTWDDHATERMSGQLNTVANFDSSFNGQETAHIKVGSSHITVKNAPWDIEPCHIVYSDKHLDISHFSISHENQHLTLHGVASNHRQDSLLVNMQDIDVEYLLGLVDFDAVDFSGYITGSGSLRGIFGNLEADGKVRVNQFEFEHGRMGTLNADVVWNKEQEQIDIHAISDDGPDAKTLVNGYVTPARDSINLLIEAQGTHLDFARSFTSSFLNHVEGHAQGAVRLIGPLDAINLTGQLVINGRIHVTTLGCDYELRNDTLQMIPNEIAFMNCPIYDVNGHQGILTGGIHHKELTNLTYDIFVKAENLLAYDFRDFSDGKSDEGSETFYGTVYATGDVAIHGRESSVVIEAEATPQQGTVFVYNAASTDAIATQEYVEWGGTAPASLQTLGTPAIAVIPADEGGREGAIPFRSDLTLRLKINATPQATMRLLMDPRTNDYITLHGNGDLQATFYNKGSFTMFGTYRVTDGTYGITIQDIIKKNFIFREGGTIVFGGDPYDATLNLQAQHTVTGVSLSDLNVGRSFSNTVRVNCLMNITGQPRAPIVDFDLEMPNVNADEQQMVRSVINGEEEMNQQVIYLLAVGRFYPQQANNANEEEGGQSKTSLAMQSLLSGTLSGQINSVLNQVIKSNNWNFGANISTGDEGWNNAEYEGVVNGRLLNNRLLINGQFGYRDNATTATPSFIGDFDIRYLLTPNGNLALKVYNQTNDRYFTKSSLNTQGIGIIMKKDFNGINDLFGIKKKKVKVNSEK